MNEVIQKKYECPHCNYKSSQKSILKIHLAGNHKIGENWYDCPFEVSCGGFKTKKREVFISHLFYKHYFFYDTEGLYGCPYCEFESEDMKQVYDHKKDKHEKRKAVKVLWERYSCRFCDFTTDLGQELLDHTKGHDLEKELERGLR